PERDAENGSGRVPAHAGQRLESVAVCREFAAVALYDDARRLVQVDRPAVVTEAGPEANYLCSGRGGERLECRESSDEPLVVGDHTVDLGLLEHQLGDQDGVRSRVGSPGQTAAVAVVPVEEPF